MYNSNLSIYNVNISVGGMSMVVSYVNNFNIIHLTLSIVCLKTICMCESGKQPTTGSQVQNKARSISVITKINHEYIMNGAYGVNGKEKNPSQNPNLYQ